MQFEIRQRGKRDVAGWWTEYNWFEELKRGSWKKTVSHVQKKAHMEVVDSEKDEGVVYEVSRMARMERLRLGDSR